LVLTERDGRILEAVYHQGLLPTALLLLAFFPPAGPASGAGDAAARRTRSSAGAERLRLLWLWEFLARVEQPVAPALGGRRPYLYALGPAAVPVLTERLGVTARAVHRRRLDRLDARALEHDHEAARLWATITAHRPQTRLTGFRWEAEPSLRARRLRVRVAAPDDDGSGGVRGRGRLLPFLPDGYAELDYPDGAVQCCVVEVDRGTQPLRKFARKLLAFEAFLEQGLFGRHFGREVFEVLVLAPSAARRRHLHAAARGAVTEARWEWYSFATPEALTAAAFPWGWWRLDEDDDSGEDGTYGLFWGPADGAADGEDG
jgi:hypothetical protein